MRPAQWALAHPVAATCAAAAVAGTAVVALATSPRWLTAPAPGATATAASPSAGTVDIPSRAPATDAQARARLGALAAVLREDPARAASADPWVVGRYVATPGSGAVTGTLALAVPGGTCWVLTVRADRAWVSSGDPTGLTTQGPDRGAPGACQRG